MIPIYTPETTQYIQSAKKALDSGWISSHGEFIKKSEDKLKEILKTQYIILTNNGTSSTHMLYRSLKFKYPHLTKIYVPNNVFVAVWNCALLEYPADMIHVMQMDAKTLNMREDEEYIKSLDPFSAVIVVHNIGNVVNVPRLKRLRPDIIFVEDNCEAFMEEYEGKKTGTESLCAAVSFFGNKIITSGEGGAFYTNDKSVYEYIYKSCHHGMSYKKYIYDVPGFNYRMTNIQAALLYDQLCNIDNIIEKKKRMIFNYSKFLKPFIVSKGLWMCVLQTKNGSQLTKHLEENGVETRPMFYDIRTHEHLRTIKNIEDSCIQHDQIFMIPSSPLLEFSQQEYISRLIIEPVIISSTPTLLDKFKKNKLPSTFRYFDKYGIENHIKTILAVDINGNPIGYGHIDFDGQKHWLGVCVLPEEQRKGIGFRIVKKLLEDQKTVYLSVDKDNIVAQNLYKKFGFIQSAETKTNYFMIRS